MTIARGFSLIEFLVVFLLLALVFYFSLSDDNGARGNLEDDANRIERAVRYGADEAALRNTIVRIRFSLNANPSELKVQSGPEGEFTLPATIIQKKETVESEQEKEKLQKAIKEWDGSFHNLDDLPTEALQVHGNVRILGVGLLTQQVLVSEGDISLYIYPTGEKDEALVILATNEEIITLEISPFTMDFRREYYPIPLDNSQELESLQFQMSKDLFEKWTKQ